MPEDPKNQRLAARKNGAEATSARNKVDGGGEAQFPDLYRPLGLHPLEEDPATIRKAIERLRTAEQEPASGTQPTDQARLLRRAKKYLLDPDRKSAYDTEYKHRFFASQDAAIPKAPAAKHRVSRALQHCLPAGNPLAEFDLAGHLSTQAIHEQEDPDREFEHLLQQLTQQTDSQTTTVETATQPKQSEPALMGAQAPKPKQLSKRLRRKRSNTFLVGAIGLLGSICLILAVIVVLTRPETTSLATQESQSREAAPPAERTMPTSDVKEDGGDLQLPRRGSGLPQVQGLEGDTDLSYLRGDSLPPNANADAQNTAESSRDINPSRELGRPAMSSGAASEKTDAQSTNPSVDAIPSNPSAAESGRAEAMDMGNADSGFDQRTMGAGNGEPALSEAEQQAWSERLRKIGDLLGEQDYSAALSALERCQQEAETQKQSNEVSALVEAARFAQQAHASILTAMEQLTAGEMLKIGRSTQIAIVEANQDKIAIRMRGRTLRYSMAELPNGLAFALIDLKNPPGNPHTKAMKACFAIFHPATNKLGLQQAQRLLRDAISAEVLPESMLTLADAE